MSEDTPEKLLRELGEVWEKREKMNGWARARKIYEIEARYTHIAQRAKHMLEEEENHNAR